MADCEMTIMEDDTLKYFWECSKCKTLHKDTRKFEKSKVCPSCGATIRNWVGLDDTYDG